MFEDKEVCKLEERKKKPHKYLIKLILIYLFMFKYLAFVSVIIRMCSSLSFCLEKG